MVAIQLDFFKTEEECELETLRRLCEDVKKSTDKVRKGTYARINEIRKECEDLRIRLEIMERNICST